MPKLIFSSFTQVLLLSLLFPFYFSNSPKVSGEENNPTFLNVVSNFAEKNETLGQYEMYELTIGLNATFDNPIRSSLESETFRDDFNTVTGTGVLLDAYFISPSGKTFKVPGFWDVDYEHIVGEVFAPTSGSHWNVRFTPKEIGEYNYYLELRDRVGSVRYPESGTEQFQTTGKSARGFLRKTDNAFLHFEDGTPYNQMGIKDPNGVGYVSEWLPRLKENGGNFVRHWLSNNDPDDIFRRNNTKWDDVESIDGEVKHEESGFSIKKTFVNAPYNSHITYQGPIGVKKLTNYKAGIWMKTDPDFSGVLNLKVEANGNQYGFRGDFISGPQTEWKLFEFNFVTRDDTKYLHFKPRSGADGTAGTVWVDDAYIYETDASGNILNGENKYNLIWNGAMNDVGVQSLEEPKYTFVIRPDQLNMLNIWKADYLLKEAEANNIIVDMAIFDYKVTSGDCNEHSVWAYFYDYFECLSTDYNQQFWKDTASIAQARNVLRYLIARFSYSTALGFWELNNEVCTGFDQNVYDWLSQTYEFLHQNDPNNHLITNSHQNSPGSSQYEHIEGLDVNSVHFYIDTDERISEGKTPHYDEYLWAVKVLGFANNNDKGRNYENNLHQHTFISGEFGLMGEEAHLSKWADPTDTTKPRHDTTGIFFHNGLWSMLTLTGFKSSISNWWFSLMEVWNYDRHFKAPAEFVKTLPFQNAEGSVRLTTDTGDTGNFDQILNITTSNTSDIRAAGRKLDNDAYLWVNNKNNTWGNVIKDGNSIANASGVITIPQFAQGNYEVTYFDTYSGQVTNKRNVSIGADGKLVLDVNLATQRPDLAIQIKTLTPNESDFEVTKSANVSEAKSGDTIDYSIIVKNISNIRNEGSLTDRIDPRLSFLTCTGNCIFDLSTKEVKWDVDLSPDANVTYILSVKVK